MSDSGQTLFVEPLAIVELGNRQAEAAGAEREEVARILRELSASVGARASALIALVEAVGEIDLALARGIVSRGWRGAPVARATRCGCSVRVIRCSIRATAVPIDLDLGDSRVLVISGPNTGGKTVALKTLGLAALLHQAGLRPPAETAALPVFDDVLADIGDRQSIEMSLSTFSGHVANLVAILGRDVALVGARRRGRVGHRSRRGLGPRAGARRAARGAGAADGRDDALPELKEWASATGGVVNAATVLDPETNEPLYRITLGRPGTSHALQTAERLGLDRAVVADARSRVEPERLRIAELLSETEAAERAAVRARGEAAAACARCAEPARRARGGGREGACVGRARAAARRRGGARVGRRPRRARGAACRDARARRARCFARTPTRRSARRRPRRARRSGRSRDARRAAADARAARAGRPGRGAGAGRARHDRGDRRRRGRGRRRAAATACDRAGAAAPGAAHAEPRNRRCGNAAARSDVSDEIDVRGQRAQEAREAVRASSTRRRLPALEVRIVHGRGTGAVRAAVRDELTAIRSSRGAASADGATSLTSSK